MARWRVLIGSRSFGAASPDHFARLEAAGCEVIPNAVGRAYRAEELRSALQDVDAIITGTDELTAEVIAGANRLKTIAKHGVGLENIDLGAARRHNVVVTATPGTNQDAVADLALALLLAVARQVVPNHNSVVAGGWPRTTGMELRGRTLGLIGFGRIGKEVAQRARAFGMRVIAYDLYPDEAYAAQHGIEFLPLHAVLQHADVVSLHAAGGKQVLGAAEIAMVKPDAIVINTARGSLIDEAALATALQEGRLAGVGLDVFVDEPPTGSPLLHLRNVVLTPHTGGQTDAALRKMGDMAVENTLRALRGDTPLYEVT